MKEKVQPLQLCAPRPTSFYNNPQDLPICKCLESGVQGQGQVFLGTGMLPIVCLSKYKQF